MTTLTWALPVCQGKAALGDSKRQILTVLFAALQKWKLRLGKGPGRWQSQGEEPGVPLPGPELPLAPPSRISMAESPRKLRVKEHSLEPQVPQAACYRAGEAWSRLKGGRLGCRAAPTSWQRDAQGWERMWQTRPHTGLPSHSGPGNTRPQQPHQGSSTPPWERTRKASCTDTPKLRSASQGQRALPLARSAGRERSVLAPRTQRDGVPPSQLASTHANPCEVQPRPLGMRAVGDEGQPGPAPGVGVPAGVEVLWWRGQNSCVGLAQSTGLCNARENSASTGWAPREV